MSSTTVLFCRRKQRCPLQQQQEGRQNNSVSGEKLCGVSSTWAGDVEDNYGMNFSKKFSFSNG